MARGRKAGTKFGHYKPRVKKDRPESDEVKPEVQKTEAAITA